MTQTNTTIIKIIKALSILAFIFYCISPAIGQSQDFTMNVKIENASSPEKADGSITVMVDKTDGIYIYILYNKEPWDGGKEISRNESAGTEYSFANLAAGDYYVCVKNKDDMTRCQKITIKTN